MITSACATMSEVERVELQMERKWYLYQCDLCDIYSKPGTPEHEQCILRATKAWLTIKEKRGWQ